MRSNYKRLGHYIQKVDIRNRDLEIKDLRGLSMTKEFRKSTSNIVGTDMSRYKIVTPGQFACDFMSVIRVHKLPVVLNVEPSSVIVSPAYTVFEIIDERQLLPEYIMMWFRRSEFDRYADFRCDSAIRGGFAWDELCEVELPIPSIEKQQEIVDEYNTVVNRIKLNEVLNRKLEETAQTLYKHWFVEFEFPITKEYAKAIGKPELEGKPYKSSGGEMVYNEELEREVPKGWEVKSLSDITVITMGQSPSGESYNEKGDGEIFYQGRTDFGFRIPEVRLFTNQPKRFAKNGDIMMSVRAPVGDLNISVEDCCIGRGLASIRSKESSYIFYVMRNFKILFDADKGTGTIFSSINKDELYNLLVIYCKEISQKFNSICKILDNRIILLSRQNQSLTEIRAVILSKMSMANEKELELNRLCQKSE